MDQKRIVLGEMGNKADIYAKIKSIRLIGIPTIKTHIEKSYWLTSWRDRVFSNDYSN